MRAARRVRPDWSPRHFARFRKIARIMELDEDLYLSMGLSCPCTFTDTMKKHALEGGVYDAFVREFVKKLLKRGKEIFKEDEGTPRLLEKLVKDWWIPYPLYKLVLNNVCGITETIFYENYLNKIVRILKESPLKILKISEAEGVIKGFEKKKEEVHRPKNLIFDEDLFRSHFCTELADLFEL